MHVLIATGGAPHSQAAVMLGAQLAKTTAVEATVIVVARHPNERNEAQRILAEAVEKMSVDVANVTGKIRVGQPAEMILAEATEGRYRLIILGTRPSHDLQTRLLGSTSDRVLDHAPCPVIIAKPPIQPIHRILLCDSGAQGRVLSRFTVQLSHLLPETAEVTVLHVMSQISAMPGVSSRQLRAEAEELIASHTPEGDVLAQDVGVLQAAQVRVKPKVRHGLVLDEILAEARTGNYDLVVIGAHQEEGWQRFLLNDVAQQLANQVDRSIAVVR